jgi:hypothetical protein
VARVTAGWARHGKEAGSYKDYAILESAGPFSAADYDAILDRYRLGNPPPGKTGPEALPWITISEVQDNRHSYLGVSVQYWTDASDGAGRPVAETLYACFPYPQFLRAPVSYRELGAALDRRDDLGADGVEVGGYAPEDHVRDIEDNRWLGRAGVVAAMLLEGPVTITNADGLNGDQRLRFIDAVAALLPYGWRTRFTASTWFRGGSPHIQLVFAQHSRGKGFDLDWRDPDPVPPFNARTARAYLHELSVLQEHGRSLLEVVAFLGTQTESLAQEEPSRAIDVLEYLDWPANVLHNARGGQAEPADLSELFESGRHRELPRDADKQFLLCELIRLGGPGYASAIERGWREMESARPEASRALVRSGRGLLWSDSPAQDVGAYLAMGDRLGFADELLAQLIPPGLVSDARSLAAVARLVGRWADPTAGTRPQTLKALGSTPGVMCELLVTQNAEASGSLAAWIDALGQVAPEGLLGPFQNLCAAPGAAGRRLRPEDINEVARHGDECVAALMRLAAARGRLDEVVHPLTLWLRSLSRPDLDHWLGRLGTMMPEDGADLALLDALQLWCRVKPTHLDAAIGPQWRAYRDALTRYARSEWVGLGLDNVQAGFVEYLTSTGWAAHQHVYPAVIEAVEAFCRVPGHDWTELARAVIRGRAVSPGMDACAEYRRWWSWIEGACPQLAEEQYMTILTALPPDARPDQIGELAAKALRRGRTDREVLTWILQSEARVTGESMVRVVNEIRRWLVDLGTSLQEADNITLHLARTLYLSGPRGLALDLQDAVSARIGDELLFQLRLLQVTSLDPPEYEYVEISERAKRGLKDAGDRIRDLMGKRIKLPWGR